MKHNVAEKWNLTLEEVEGVIGSIYYWTTYDETPDLVKRLILGLPVYRSEEDANKALEDLWIEVQTFVGREA